MVVAGAARLDLYVLRSPVSRTLQRIRKSEEDKK